MPTFFGGSGPTMNAGTQEVTEGRVKTTTSFYEAVHGHSEEIPDANTANRQPAYFSNYAEQLTLCLMFFSEYAGTATSPRAKALSEVQFRRDELALKKWKKIAKDARKDANENVRGYIDTGMRVAESAPKKCKSSESCCLIM